ncbi:winged helix-turn-helix transcriptional regulator [candidate division WOR-3 bacterium]|nr:winged helix-turn-helix transcriptional regulator [candidate division WOR-3 bacterium]
MDPLILIFKAVSNENRVKIIEFLIQNEEASLETLSLEIEPPYKTVDRNLKILEKAGLVKQRRWRGFVYYSLQDSKTLKYNNKIFDLIKLYIKNRQR